MERLDEVMAALQAASDGRNAALAYIHGCVAAFDGLDIPTEALTPGLVGEMVEALGLIANAWNEDAGEWDLEKIYAASQTSRFILSRIGKAQP